jgi:hypothetical protein
MYAITLDNPWDYKKVVTTLKPFNKKVWVRIVVDTGVPISEYVIPFKAIAAVAPVMCMLCDSFVFKDLTAEQYLARTIEIHKLLGAFISVYEIGNEINGDWLGTDVSNKVSVVRNYLGNNSLKTSLTMYSDELDSWKPWMTANASVVSTVDWLLLSEYPADNNGHRVNFADFTKHCKSLNTKALIGWGECGIVTISKKVAEFNYYYKTQNDLYKLDSRYLGGYFWWYQKDFVSVTPKLLPNLKALLV